MEHIVFVDRITSSIYESLISHILYSKSFETYKKEYINKYIKQKTENEILMSNDFIKFTFIIMSIKTDFNTEFSYKNYKGLYSQLINNIYIHVLHCFNKDQLNLDNNTNLINDDLIKSLLKSIKRYYIKTKDEEIRKDFYIQIKKLIKSFNSVVINQEINTKIKEIYQEL